VDTAVQVAEIEDVRCADRTIHGGSYRPALGNSILPWTLEHMLEVLGALLVRGWRRWFGLIVIFIYVLLRAASFAGIS
jgi:hypothetical protein